MKVRILPFLEQQPLFNAVNFEVEGLGGTNSRGTAINATVITTKINSFLCPSDPNPGNAGTFTVGTVVFTHGVTNYPNNLGSERRYTGNKTNGPSWLLGGHGDVGVRVSLASVTDGTSSTAIFSEWVKGKSGGTMQGTNANYSNITLGPAGGRMWRWRPRARR
jgi:hypothetical protein